MGFLASYGRFQTYAGTAVLIPILLLCISVFLWSSFKSLKSDNKKDSLKGVGYAAMLALLLAYLIWDTNQVRKFDSVASSYGLFDLLPKIF